MSGVTLSARALRLKAAMRDLVAACGGQEGAAASCGRGQQRISTYGQRNSDVFAPIDVIAALEAVARAEPGYPHVTRALAAEAGFALIALPDPYRPATKWSRFVAELAREAGETISGIAGDLADDNDVSPAEARGRLKDADELIEIAVQLRAALAQRAEDDR
jgi:hypothetical protein